jgi:hypothetical protein
VIETYVDINTGTRACRLFIGAEAIEASGLHMGQDVVPLAELVTASTVDFPVQYGDFEPLDTATWTPDDYHAWGAWVIQILDARKPRDFVRRHVDNLHALGLGPASKKLGNFTAFKTAAGNLEARPSRSEWSIDDFIQLAARAARHAKGRPSETDYAAVLSLKTPGLDAIRTRFGGIPTLNELLGYPDYREWDPDDFTTYGVQFIKANEYDTAVLTSLSFDIPATKGRGPWSRRMIKDFGSWEHYKEATLDAFHAERAQKTERYRSLIASGRLPGKFAELCDKDLDRAVARYRVLTDLSNFDEERRTILALADSTMATFIYKLLHGITVVTRAEIERSAMTYGVYDDLFPPLYVAHLAISAEERAAVLEQARTEQRIRHNNLREREHPARRS